MGLIKLTFNDCLNTARHDASFNRYLTNNKNGVIKGLGGEVKARAKVESIVLDDGYVIGHGRRVYIEKGTSIDINLVGNKKGRISVFIDAKNETAKIEKVEIPISSAPDYLPGIVLSQDSYECPICYYEIKDFKIKITEGVSDFVELPMTLIERTATEINKKTPTFKHELTFDPAAKIITVDFTDKERVYVEYSCWGKVVGGGMVTKGQSSLWLSGILFDQNNPKPELHVCKYEIRWEGEFATFDQTKGLTGYWLVFNNSNGNFENRTPGHANSDYASGYGICRILY